MRLRARLMVLSVSTVAVIVAVLIGMYLDSLTNFWLDSAAERSNVAGNLIQSLIALHISDGTADAPSGSLAQTKRAWNRIVTGDKDLADMVVKQAAEPSGVIVEINVIGEDGKVVVSSIPSRQGQDAPARPSLDSLRDSGFLGRLTAIATSRTDYESRVPLGLPDQQKPVFDIQLLVSPVLLRDKILPGLKNTGVVSLLALLAAVGLAGVSAHLALLPVRRIGKAIDTLSTGRPLGLTMPTEDPDDREIAAVEYKLSLLGRADAGCAPRCRPDAERHRQPGAWRCARNQEPVERHFAAP